MNPILLAGLIGIGLFFGQRTGHVITKTKHAIHMVIKKTVNIITAHG